MNFGSVCSGIEAASQAWHPLGWRPTFFSEIEPFPCAALAHHYPEVPNFGDMTKSEEWPDASIDVLVGGTPCQSFSVAGLRKGLGDPRGNLMLTFGAIARRYRPEWLVWENVPGVLSSGGGRDFGSFLGMLGILGYGFAYRVLDAQFFGVAQRRRRVFVVANSRGWQRAAAVLFERESLWGHPAPRRETGEGTAGSTRASAARRGGIQGQHGEGLVPDVSFALNAGAMGRCDAESETLLPLAMPTADIIGTLNSAGGHGVPGDNVQDASSHMLIPMQHVTHALTGEGFDASEDGSGRGTPIVPIAFDTTQITHPDNRSNPQPGDACHPLAAGAHAPAIVMPAHAFDARQSDVIQYGDKTGPLDTDPSTIGVLQRGMAVRRLTPRECERLQGFPDDYTQIPYRGKPAELCPDGPRYKALGNSMAVPVMNWIGKRIELVREVAP